MSVAGAVRNRGRLPHSLEANAEGECQKIFPRTYDGLLQKSFLAKDLSLRVLFIIILETEDQDESFYSVRNVQILNLALSY